MKSIVLTQGQVALVDDKDFESLKKYKWCAQYTQGTKSYYAFRRRPTSEGRGVILMHRVITNAQENMEVDHVNFDTLDNRSSNLRLCTRSQNCSNRRKFVTNTSGFKGVSWDKAVGKWKVLIVENGRRKHVGRYHDIKEAAEAYNSAALKNYGEFALLNKQ